MILADELGIFRHSDPQLGPLELQRLGQVVADDLPRTVLGAVLVGLRHFGQHFVARQVGGKFFRPRLAFFERAADGVLLEDLLGFRRRIGQAVLHARVVAEVELSLGRICGPFAAMSSQTRQQLLDRQIQLLVLLRQLLTSGREIDDRRGLLDDQRVTGIQILRERTCVLHVEMKLPRVLRKFGEVKRVFLFSDSELAARSGDADWRATRRQQHRQFPRIEFQMRLIGASRGSS